MKLRISKINLNKKIDNEIDVSYNHLSHINLKICGEGIYNTNAFSEESKYKCECGHYHKKSVKCPICGVVARKPISYFTMPVSVIRLATDFDNIPPEDRKNVKAFLEYEAYVKLGDNDEFEILPYSSDAYEDENEKIIFGGEAVRFIYGDKYDEFMEYNFKCEQNLVAFKYRRPVVNKMGKVVNTELNMLYIKLISHCANYRNILEYNLDNFVKLALSYKFYQNYKEFNNEFINKLYVGKTSIIKKNVITQKLGGAVRATIIPCPGIPEDCVALSTKFADVLFPQLIGLWKDAKELNELISWGHFPIPSYMYYHKFDKAVTNKKGYGVKAGFLYPWEKGFDYEELCKYKNNTLDDIKRMIHRLANPDRKYYVIVNRPPTICHLSFQAYRPIFFDNIGRGTYAENFDKIGDEFINNSVKDKTEVHDYEKNNGYGGINDYSIVMGINPCTCSGFNGDFDGDVLATISIFSQGAKQEEKIKEMLASNNYKTISNGNIRNGLEEMHRYFLPYIYDNESDKAEEIHNLITSLYNKRG